MNKKYILVIIVDGCDYAAIYYCYIAKKKGKKDEKIKKILGVAVLALCFTIAAKADTQAAGKITGIKQVGAGTSSVKVSVDADL